MSEEKLIEFDIKVFENGTTMFVTHYVLPTGDIIFKDEDDPDRVGFSYLIPYEGYKAKVNYSDGRPSKYVTIHDITEDDLRFTNV
ncbi:hypothetical protein CPT_Moonbeam92 [Bacillus phage Moonbeam]|uniref:Uncharacterized protein n=1 Tax=Bacillus phage Moonbeam TaxID=1540091 RepID=A0A0A0RN55_9CAUD|nr:hypothetical protein CPT_Moonbeam92 [Bacillus phage Moonbeam]AIW03490.1 hypothetical protein CPT_Moonbeam92 [Bacillus phage Moonbeam]